MKNLQSISFFMLVMWGLTANPVFLAGFPLLFALLGFDLASLIRQSKEASKTLNPITESLRTVWFWFLHVHIGVLITLLWVLREDQGSREGLANFAFAMSTGFGNWQQIMRPENYFGFDSQTNPFIHLWVVNSIIQIALLILAIGFLFTLRKSSIPANLGRFGVLGMLAIAGYLGFNFRQNLLLTSDYFLSTWTWLWATAFGLAMGSLQFRFSELRRVSVMSDIAFLVVMASLVIGYFNPSVINEFIFFIPLALMLVLVLSSRNETFSYQIMISPFVTRVTEISFGAFIWHWPLAQIAKNYLGVEIFGALEVFGVFTGSYVFAFGSTFIVKKVSVAISNLGGLRQWTARVATVAVLPLGLFFFQTPVTNDVQPNPSPTITFTPMLEEVENDVPQYLNDPKCKIVKSGCMYGNKNSKTHLVLFGNELSGNWQPALSKIALENDWKLEVRINPRCPSPESSDECAAWLKRMEQYFKRVKPEVVLTNFSSRRSSSTSGSGQVPSQTSETLNSDITIFETLIQNKIKVVLLRGASTAPENPVQCLLAAVDFKQECLFDRAGAYLNPDELQRRLVFMPTGVEIVDLTDRFCTQEVCFIANDDAVVIYRTSTLVTKTFSLLLAESLSPTLQKILDSPISKRPYNCRENDRRPECAVETALATP